MAKSRFIMSKTKSTGMLKGAMIVTDSETGVQYLFVASGYAGGLTLLVDKDGKPLIDKSNKKTAE